MFTDYEALQVLLNTPHPSGKLARWGMALQEMDLPLHYKPDKLIRMLMPVHQLTISQMQIAMKLCNCYNLSPRGFR